VNQSGDVKVSTMKLTMVIMYLRKPFKACCFSKHHSYIWYEKACSNGVHVI